MYKHSFIFYYRYRKGIWRSRINIQP